MLSRSNLIVPALVDEEIRNTDQVDPGLARMNSRDSQCLTFRLVPNSSTDPKGTYVLAQLETYEHFARCFFFESPLNQGWIPPDISGVVPESLGGRLVPANLLPGSTDGPSPNIIHPRNHVEALDISISGSYCHISPSIQASLYWFIQGAAQLRLCCGLRFGKPIEQVIVMFFEDTSANYFTELPLLCWAPSETEVGDVISVVHGVKLPMILRPIQGHPKQYRIVGPCYVHGYMNGEVAEMEDLIPEDVMIA
jgi:hypothetical protein